MESLPDTEQLGLKHHVAKIYKTGGHWWNRTLGSEGMATSKAVNHFADPRQQSSMSRTDCQISMTTGRRGQRGIHLNPATIWRLRTNRLFLRNSFKTRPQLHRGVDLANACIHPVALVYFKFNDWINRNVSRCRFLASKSQVGKRAPWTQWTRKFGSKLAANKTPNYAPSWEFWWIVGVLFDWPPLRGAGNPSTEELSSSGVWGQWPAVHWFLVTKLTYRGRSVPPAVVRLRDHMHG